MQSVSILEELKKKGMQCTGCGACRNICPVNAIQMQEDMYGFLYPSIDSFSCVNCKKCINTCPVLNEVGSKNEIPSECYAVQADNNTRMESSSGGAFTVFAKEILLRGGVVCGVYLDENLYASHICIENVGDLSKLRKSKYVQSDIGYVYQEVKEAINHQKHVLFSGTPCQIAGLYAFLGEQSEKLITVDIICHGVPSQRMLRESVEDGINGKRVISIDFRDKDYGWESLAMTLTLEDGTKRRLSYDESRYEQGFHPNMTLRESCFSCRFCEFPRRGDLSIGDFWSIADYDLSLADQKGTSVVVVNSSKGGAFFEKIKSGFAKCQRFTLDALKRNRITKDIVKDASRDYFLELYEKKDFNQSVYYAQQRKYDIGIVGNWSYPNYGSALTYYALYKTLKNMGYAVGMVSWPKSSQWKPYENQELFLANPYKEYEILPIPEKRDDLFALGEKCELFVLGSDQLLNNNLYHWFDKFVLMDWVPAYKRKVAYAASFGCDYVWGEQMDHAEMAHFLQQYDCFSTREESGSKLLKEIYGVEAQVVLDPVFLMDVSELYNLAKAGESKIPKGKYLFVYILDPNMDKAEVLSRCGQELELKPYSVRDAAPDEHTLNSSWNIETECNVKLEEWVSYIKNSEFVVTDSFHGMCVAILLKKNFFAIVNHSRGATRFYEIAKKLGLESRLISSIYDLPQKIAVMREDINYDEVENKLLSAKGKSYHWLKKALCVEDKVKSLTDYDILSRELSAQRLFCQDIKREQTEQLEKFEQRFEKLNSQKREVEEKLVELEQKLLESEQKSLELEQKSLGYKLYYFLKKLCNR